MAKTLYKVPHACVMQVTANGAAKTLSWLTAKEHLLCSLICRRRMRLTSGRPYTFTSASRNTAAQLRRSPLPWLLAKECPRT